MDPFEAIVGPDNIAGPDVEDLDGVSVESVVRPANAEQVAACLVVAREGKRLLVCGARTKLHWGNLVHSDRVTLLDLSRLSDHLDLQPDEGIVSAAAGISLGELARRSAEVGKRTLLLGHAERATIGGTIAADPIGLRFSLDRRLRHEILGLEVALSNGEVTRSGGKVVKNVTGFDLVRLYCGSLGTLGVITEATMRMRAVPEARRLLVSEYPDSSQAVRAGARIAGDTVEPQALVVRQDEERVRLLCLLEGSARGVERCADSLPGEPVGIQAWDELEQSFAARQTPPGSVRVRLAGRLSDAVQIVAAVSDLGGAGALDIALPVCGVAFAVLEETALAALWQRAAESGWSLFIESASAETKAQFDVFGPNTENLPLMHAIKSRFDPGSILAPGRFTGRL